MSKNICESKKKNKIEKDDAKYVCKECKEIATKEKKLCKPKKMKK